VSGGHLHLLIYSPHINSSSSKPISTTLLDGSNPDDMALVRSTNPVTNAGASSSDSTKQGLADSHPYHNKWPQWMFSAVSILEKVCNHKRWSDFLGVWLDFKDLLGYPYGQVSQILRTQEAGF
jgi:hypothetical protein